MHGPPVCPIATNGFESSEKHPLNANFLHPVLFDMEVAERDLRWTEWLRQNREEISRDLEQLEQRWFQSKERDDADHASARNSRTYGSSCNVAN